MLRTLSQSNSEDLASSMNPIVYESMVEWCVLPDKHFNGFLRCHSSEEGTYSVDLGVTASDDLSDIGVFHFNTAVTHYLV